MLFHLIYPWSLSPGDCSRLAPAAAANASTACPSGSREMRRMSPGYALISLQNGLVFDHLLLILVQIVVFIFVIVASVFSVFLFMLPLICVVSIGSDVDSVPV